MFTRQLSAPMCPTHISTSCHLTPQVNFISAPHQILKHFSEWLKNYILMINILVIGKKHEDWVQVGIERYEKRLKQPWNVSWELIAHSAYDGDRAREEESERILSRLKPDDEVLLLDERGGLLTSPLFSSQLEQGFNVSKRTVIVIGGAYGVSTGLQSRADKVISLSKMVFPHQLVRLILIEQLYRAQEIARGGGYHHE